MSQNDPSPIDFPRALMAQALKAGAEAAEVIRRDSPVPIMFFTGHSSVSMREQAARIEGTGFLEKTADMELLRKHIYLVLSHLRSTGV